MRITSILMALSGLIAAVRSLWPGYRTEPRDVPEQRVPYNLTPLQLRAKAEIDEALDAGRVADIRLPRRAGSTYLAHIVHKERGGVVVALNPAHARRFRDEHMFMFGEQPDVTADAGAMLLCGSRGPVIIDTCGPERPGQAVAVANRQGAVRFWDEDMWNRWLAEQERMSLDLRSDHWIVASFQCAACGSTVEESRRCYATPVCYRCLPPPPVLPFANRKRELADRVLRPSRPHKG